MKRIDSAQNPHIKQTAALKDRKARRESGLLLVEGLHAIEEAARAGLVAISVFVQESAARMALPEMVTAEWYQVPETLMGKLATTDSPPPVLATFRAPKPLSEDVLSDPANPAPLMLVLDDLQDPGNVGTLLRCAVAFQVAAIVTTSRVVDPFSPKVIRASAGLVFRCPLLSSARNLPDLTMLLQGKGFRLLFTSSHPEGAVVHSYREPVYSGPTAIVLGNEGKGLPSQGLQDAVWLTIPTAPEVESLNVALSGAIILSEAFAQRRVPMQSA
jgi:TrmH family RNA methyltransferase